VLSYYLHTQLDLHENGLVLRSKVFWLWRQVELSHRDFNTYGKLAFTRGWRRIVAYVAPDQRDVVDALLKEKLGEEMSDV
jgi:hypothetical protein